MQAPFWSDEDRPFIAWALGVSLNLKWVARRLGLIGRPAATVQSEPEAPAAGPVSREDRLRDQIESSKFEERR
jgi:hypothetical protein